MTAPIAALGEAAALVMAQVGLQDAGTGTAVGMWLARGANYLTLTATVGLLLCAAVLLPASPRLDGAAAAAVRRGGAAAALWAASAVALLVFGTSNASARPLPGALLPEIVGTFAGTRFGTAVLVQAAIAMLVAVIALRARSRAAATAALVITGLGGFAPAWWGHAGTQDLRVLALVNDWAHVLAVTVWMGGLGALVWLALRRTDAGIAEPVRRFSGLAGWALALVLATGVVNALLGISAPGQLLDTSWGRLVLVKLVLLGGLFYAGQRQRRRIVPRLGEDRAGGLAAFRTLALAEVGIMLVAMGAATTMAAGIPAEVEAASRIQSIFAAFGDGQINATVDPAVSGGSNYLHLYFLGDDGQLRDDVSDPVVTFTSGGQAIDAQLFVAGDGHWSAPTVPLPDPGTWRITIAADIAGQPATTSGALTVR